MYRVNIQDKEHRTHTHYDTRAESATDAIEKAIRVHCSNVEIHHKFKPLDNERAFAETIGLEPTRRRLFFYAWELPDAQCDDCGDYRDDVGPRIQFIRGEAVPIGCLCEPCADSALLSLYGPYTESGRP